MKHFICILLEVFLRSDAAIENAIKNERFLRNEIFLNEEMLSLTQAVDLTLRASKRQIVEVKYEDRAFYFVKLDLGSLFDLNF